MKKIKGIKITVNQADPTQCLIEYGPEGITAEVSSLFNQDDSNVAITKNLLRSALLVAGVKYPNSDEYIRTINIVRGGLELPKSKCFIRKMEVLDAASGTYDVAFSRGSATNPPEFGFTVSREELQQDSEDWKTVIANLPAFFRKAGHTSLTPAAINAVKNYQFTV